MTSEYRPPGFDLLQVGVVSSQRPLTMQHEVNGGWKWKYYEAQVFGWQIDQSLAAYEQLTNGYFAGINYGPGEQASHFERNQIKAVEVGIYSQGPVNHVERQIRSKTAKGYSEDWNQLPTVDITDKLKQQVWDELVRQGYITVPEPTAETADELANKVATLVAIRDPEAVVLQLATIRSDFAALRARWHSAEDAMELAEAHARSVLLG